MAEVALVEPKIPQNTGSIARTCAALNVTLNIVGMPAFDMSDKAVRRAGLDYWRYVTVKRFSSFNDFISQCKGKGTMWFFSKKGKMLYTDVSYSINDILVFGSETEGLKRDILERYFDNSVRIPIFNSGVRSLNLSNAVSIALYEIIRQTGG